jgi:hypothetical protein
VYDESAEVERQLELDLIVPVLDSAGIFQSSRYNIERMTVVSCILSATKRDASLEHAVRYCRLAKDRSVHAPPRGKLLLCNDIYRAPEIEASLHSFV